MLLDNFGGSLVRFVDCRRAVSVVAGTLLVLIGAMPPALAGFEEGFKALQANDFATAEKELLTLMKERDPRAQVLMAIYIYGNPDSKLLDFNKAGPLLLDAAERGYTSAMIPLAGAYADGKGVPKSFVEAYKWLAIAERWNTPNAGQLMEQVARELQPADIEKAKAEAAAYTFKTK